MPASAAPLHCSCCCSAHLSVHSILSQQQGVGGTSELAAADRGDKELRAMNCVPTDAAAQRLLGLKSSGA